MVADAGVPYATITLGTAPRTPGRCVGTIRLEKGDMIFAADDYLSLGVIAAQRRSRVEPPRDVGLVAYANCGSGLFVGDEFARIEHDPFLDGREIARCIAEKRELGTGGDRPRDRPVFRVFCVFRGYNTRSGFAARRGYTSARVFNAKTA